MNYLTPQNILDAIFIIGGIAFTISQVSLGRATKKSGDETDALTTIKIKDLTIETLQNENRDIKGQLIKQGERMAVLESDNKRLEAIVANRNPELESFMKNTSTSLLTIEKSIEVLLKNITVNITNLPK